MTATTTTQTRWHTVTLQDRETGERTTTPEKGADQDDANQRAYQRTQGGDLDGQLIVIT